MYITPVNASTNAKTESSALSEVDTASSFPKRLSKNSKYSIIKLLIKSMSLISY